MVIKPTVLNWMREEFAQGMLDNIPAEALAILKAEEEAKKKGPRLAEVKKEKTVEVGEDR